MSVQLGIIAGIGGHPMSGLWQLVFEDGNVVHVESGYGVRNLVACFGSLENLEGQEIFYSVDFVGVLEGFTPTEEASPELWEAYEESLEEEGENVLS